MTPEHWIAISGILAGFATSIFTIWINRKDAREQAAKEGQRHAEELRREAAHHKELIEREDYLRREQRLDQRHIEYTIDSEFFGPVQDCFLAEIRLCAYNKGQTVQRFSTISLRVRSVPRDTQLSRWEDHGDRALFPEKLVDARNIIPNGMTYFTEPGIRQVFTFVTTIPASQRFLLVQSEFDYMGEVGKSHDCERVFALPEATDPKENDPRESNRR